MRYSKAGLAVVTVLAAVASFPACADRGRHGGHSAAPHSASGHAAPSRHYRSSPRVGLYVGVPVAAAYYYTAPRYYAPAPAYWYFCPAYNDYYPRVQQCPGPWQRVLAQPPAPAAYYPG